MERMTPSDLETWLKDQTATLGDDHARQVAIWMASRIAARVLPLAWDEFTFATWAHKHDLTAFPILWSNTLTRIAGTMPTHAAAASADTLAAAATHATHATHAAAATAAAATAAAADTLAATHAATAAAATHAATAAAATHAATHAADAAYLEKNAFDLNLTAPPLWHGKPNPLDKNWAALKYRLRENNNDDWSFFIEDYDHQLAGTDPEWPVLYALTEDAAIEVWERQDLQELNELVKTARASAPPHTSTPPTSHPSPSTDLPFVFLSYAKQDEQYHDQIRDLCASKGFTVWSMKDIEPGASWRKTIETKLEQACAVVTLWTPHAVNSDNVIEEAQAGKQNNKLVHILREECSVPYGFSSVQYSDLRGWDGKTIIPPIQFILEALERRCASSEHIEITLNNNPALNEHLNKASPVAFPEQNNVVDVQDRPQNQLPEILDPNELSNLFVAQIRSVEMLIMVIEKHKPNGLPIVISDYSNSYIDALNSQRDIHGKSWLIINAAGASLKYALAEVIEEAALEAGMMKLCKIIIKHHDDLRRYIQPKLLPSNHPKAVAEPPIASLAEFDTDNAGDIVKDIGNAKEENLLTPNAATVLNNAIDDVSKSQQPIAPSSPEKVETATKLLLRRTVIATTVLTTFTAEIATSALSAHPIILGLITKLEALLNQALKMF